MFPLMTETPLSPVQIVTATRLMLGIAHVDGACTTQEEALIRQFYDGSRTASTDFLSFDALVAERGVVSVAAGDFSDTGQRDMIVALCIMVAFADGDYSAAERAAVVAAAASLGLNAERVEQILAQVKDYMLAQLAHLPDAASVAVVAKELG